MGIASMTLEPHGIPRDEWVRRFCAEILRAGGMGEETAIAELASWPEHDPTKQGQEDWKTDLPEHAAQENMSYWDDDGA